MIDFKIADGALVFKDGDVQFVDGAERVRQQLDFILNLWRGEWFLDSQFGTPYVTDVLGKQKNLNSVLAVIRKQIMSVQGVNAITSFEYNFDRPGRTLSVKFTAATVYGLVQYPKAS